MYHIITQQILEPIEKRSGLTKHRLVEPCNMAYWIGEVSPLCYVVLPLVFCHNELGKTARMCKIYKIMDLGESIISFKMVVLFAQKCSIRHLFLLYYTSSKHESTYTFLL